MATPDDNPNNNTDVDPDDNIDDYPDDNPNDNLQYMTTQMKMTIADNIM
jgi:hypothetical protein